MLNGNKTRFVHVAGFLMLGLTACGTVKDKAELRRSGASSPTAAQEETTQNSAAASDDANKGKNQTPTSQSPAENPPAPTEDPPPPTETPPPPADTINPITNFAATPTSSAVIHLSWAAPQGVSAYRLSYQVGTSAPADCSTGKALGNVSAYDVNGLAALTDYAFRLCPLDADQAPVMEASATAGAKTSAANVAPSIVSKSPLPNATGVSTSTLVKAVFSEAVQTSTIVGVLKDASGSVIPTSLSYDAASLTATMAPNASLAAGTAFTATISGAKDLDGLGMNGTVSWSFTTAAAQAPTTGATYYVSSSSSSGLGTLASPYGLPDVLHADSTPGVALSKLQPGDTLYFMAGDYHFKGTSDSNSWSTQMLGPTTSGTAAKPITLQAYPGAKVRIFEDSGGQPVFGTITPNLSYVRFIGFIVDGGLNEAFHISGTGVEVAYNEVIGHYVATMDNHDGMRIDGTKNAWIHHNDVHGWTGDGPNSTGIKEYQSTNLIVENNYVHDNTTGIHDKDGGAVAGNGNTYRRNWITNSSPSNAFLGNNQGAQALYYIYDNVIDGTVNLYTAETGTQVYNNLIRTSGDPGPIGAWMGVYQINIWNNVTISNGQPTEAYGISEVSFSKNTSTSPLSYMDYNVYDGTPSYVFKGSSYSLAQFQAQGFEAHSTKVAGASSIFQNLTTYALLPQWQTAGRYGDAVGPRYPVAAILDTSRYGPAALGSRG